MKQDDPHSKSLFKALHQFTQAHTAAREMGTEIADRQLGGEFGEFFKRAGFSDPSKNSVLKMSEGLEQTFAIARGGEKL